MSPASVDRRSGLANVVDIIIAPQAAFERLRTVPTWGWAFLVASLLGIAGTLLAMPALLHAADASMPAQLAATPQIAKLPPGEQQNAIATQMKFIKISFQFAWIFVPIGVLIVSLIQAGVMLVANAAGHGDGSFKKFYALSMNVAVVGVGLSSIVVGLIVMLRGANSYESMSAVQGSVPGLGMLAPGLKGAAAGFIAAFNVFSVWATVLLALGMTGVAKIPRVPAWTAAILLLLATAAYGAFGAARNG
ncbi:MAG: hypothetical protein NVS3B7_11390 [Candidatus Elarobacter sp.]